MLRNKLYYTIKPLLPDGVRMRLRRWYSHRVRGRVADRWPMAPGSARPPAGWPGWPEGKKFAVVLTHDVEGPEGVAKCRDLMKLERELGFVSSFNFIPEGTYETPADLRAELTRHGFEVGVHDLHHDGHLYDSATEFRRHAQSINRHVREWGAAGFRSGFMFNRLDWLHQLDVAYDASTFDTDPFEPQPDGQSTIFPFWVPAPAGVPSARGGYVELPYTLIQDSTLFLLLGESTIDIWKRKVDWIAENGGMVLLNVHPDYLAFEERAVDLKTFPADLYRAFLTDLKARFGDSFWQPLPREVAAFVSESAGRPVHRRPRRVAMVAHSYYEMDGRVQRYAESLAARGDEVHVLAVRQSPSQPKDEVLNGVQVHRLTDRSSKKKAGKWAFLWMIAGFMGRCALWLTRQHRHRPFDLLHIHNMPDFLVFAGLLPKMAGTAILLDVHDLLPEFFNSKFAPSDKAPLPWHLLLAEKLSAKVADHVIVANDLWLERYAKRTGTVGRSSAWINYVDARLFQPQPSDRSDGKLILMFPGGLYWHQGVDLVVKAMPAVLKAVPNAEFHIYGDGDQRETLQTLSQSLGLQQSVIFHSPVPSREIAGLMAQADLAVVPKRADSFGNEAYSTKIMEFMSLGVPVIASATRIDTFYFNESVIRFFESGNIDQLSSAVIELLLNPEQRAGQAARARQFAASNTWQAREAEYLRLVDSLCNSDREWRPEGASDCGDKVASNRSHPDEWKAKA